MRRPSDSNALVRLDGDGSPWPPPPALIAELEGELRRLHWNRYPDREAAALREDLAAMHGVDPTQVFVVSSAAQAMLLVCLAYGGAGRGGADFQPTDRLHRHVATVAGMSFHHGRRSADFSLDIDEAIAFLVTCAPAVTFLCSPNEPTGMLESLPMIRELLVDALGVIVVDESRGHLSPQSAVELVDDELPLVVVRTVSHVWSLAAISAAYLIGPSWLVTELAKVSLPYHLDAGSQLAARVALRFCDDGARRVQRLNAERARLAAGLDCLPVDQWPSDGNFVLFRGRDRAGPDLWRSLCDRSVLVRDVSGAAGLTDCLRVSVGTTDENDAFLAALAASV